jgi:hypothetical protein
MRHDQLLAAVRRDPDDGDAWAVLQDWLLAHDDPRGALALASGDDLVAQLSATLPQWFDRPVHPLTHGWRVRRVHRAKGDVGVRFLGDDNNVHGPAVDLLFERGHVRRLAVDTVWDGSPRDWGRAWMCPLLAQILTHPVGQAVVDLELRATPNRDFFYEGLVDTIAAAGPVAVRRVYCGDSDQLSWTNVPDVSALWAAAPALEEAVLQGSAIRVGDLSHRRLRKLHLLSGGLTREPVQALVRGALPALQDLDVWFGDPEYGAECDMDDVRRLMGHDFPALVRMGLSNSEFGDTIAAELPNAVWLPRIRALSLFGSVLTDAGGEALLRHADRLLHLEVLDLRVGFLTPPMVERLEAAFGARLVADSQRTADVWGDDPPEYYVSVGE